MLRRALLLAAVLGLAAAYSTGNYDNDRYNNYNGNSGNNGNNGNNNYYGNMNERNNDNDNDNYYNGNNDRKYNNNNNDNSYYNDNNNFNNNYDYNSYNNQNQKPKPKAIFCFLNATNIMPLPYHEDVGETRIPFKKENIRAELCTHIVYNAVELDLNQFKIRPTDMQIEQNSGSRITYSELHDLKRKHSHLKLILSLSGKASDFSSLARHTGQHASFAKNVKQYLLTNDFDGIIIDWRYPRNDDRLNYRTLIKTLKLELRRDGFILAGVLPPHRKLIEDGFERSTELFESVDYWFIMAVELSNNWHNIKASAPMDSREDGGIKQLVGEIRSTFEKYQYKLILVIPFGGKQLFLNSESATGESPYEKSRQGPHEEKFAYIKICKMMSANTWARKWLPLEQVAYATRGNLALVYEDARSVEIKTNFALTSGLGGVMAYTIEMDDYEGTCLDNAQGWNNKAYNDRTNRARDRSQNANPLLQSIFDTVQRYSNSAGLQTSSLALIVTIAIAMVLGHNG